ncbi:uncharacterized protein LOC108135327 [Drosophila elegans]|uniref:uncharacterized protein LOC108135327 n=1 Tax=Drosophila elegans TaxID=30023 RepID=UPI0007E6782D|nr:uncharacterized protein LOC108135327 [Drosophila elegans]
MVISSGSVQQLVLLGAILLAINLFGVQARKLKIHKLEKGIEETEYLHSLLRIAEFKENVLQVSGELKLYSPMDNSWTIRFRVYRAPEEDGEYEKIWDLNEMHVCDIMKSYYKDFFYEQLKEYSNAPHPSTCPVPPDHYILEDYPLDVHLLKKIMTPGYYRTNFKLSKGHVAVLSYTAELEIE